jgi:CRISPR-associated endonuclease Csn1
LDIGTGSVGWAVIGDDYRLKRAKGKNLIGVRLFNPADTAEERRGYRTTRRRISRRRWRLRLLNEIFASELEKVDENFLSRLKYSWVHPKDDQNPQINQYAPNGALFGTVEADKEFHKKYPTIYHLRKKLMEDASKHDLREVYLAIHHIVKYRGHFLTDGEINSEKSFDAQLFIEQLRDFDDNFYLENNLFLNLDQEDLSSKISSILTNSKISKSKRVEDTILYFELADKTKEYDPKKILEFILKAVVGNKIDIINIFSLKKDELDKETKDALKISYSDENIDDKLNEISDLLPDERQIEFLQTLKESFDGLTLKMLLGESKSISDAMIARYDEHKVDLKFIKENIINNFSKEQKDEFNQNYKKHLTEKDVDNVTKYFKKIIEESEINENKKSEFLLKIEDNEFLPAQRSKTNGSIPHQLHRNELDLIIENQKKYYPFLAEEYTQENKTETKLAGLVNFRVPYYVGPLVSKEKANKNNKDGGQNHWVEFKGDSTKLTPWNFSEIVDKDKSGQKFIERLVGTDTYLIGEPTMPKNSLLYQKFNVLQELNNVRWNKKSKYNTQRLSAEDKKKIFEKIFKKKINVSGKDIEEYLLNEYGEEIEIGGLSDKTGKKFNNKLSSYHYLIKQLGQDFVDSTKDEILEQIIQLQTIFEDKEVLLRQLKQIPELNDEQALKLASKHFTGWGNLSKKLLTSKIVDTRQIDPKRSIFRPDAGKQSIIETLYNTNLNLSEIINNVGDVYGVHKWIEEQNTTNDKDVYEQIQELVGDKKVKRGITQSFRILDDIKKAMGGLEPDRVYLEFARETQQGKVSNSRLNLVKNLYDNKELKNELKSIRDNIDNKDLQNDRLYLYLLQQGKDMYTGESLNFDNLSNYDIDHIIPQAYTKDNSIENRVLVSSTSNRLKNDSSIVPIEIQNKMIGFWKQLEKQGFISKRKLENLIRRRDFSAQKKERFIARALVETRQIILNVSNLINEHFENTKAVAVKSDMTSDMRKYVDLPKNRDINDYHHAHDALMVATVGKYIENKGIFENGKLSDDAGNQYNRYTKSWIERARKNANYERVNPFGFVVGQMKNATNKKVDYETGDIITSENEYWNRDNLDYLNKVLDYKNILVTKQTLEKQGNLYDQTRYGITKKSGKNSDKLNAFNKKHKSVDLYGGFSSPLTSFTSLIKNKKSIELVNISLSEAKSLQKDSQINVDDLQKYLRSKTEGINKKGELKYSYPFAEVIIPKVLNLQLIVKNGQKIYAVGMKESNNAEQLVVDRKIYKLIDMFTKSSEDKLREKVQKEMHFNDPNDILRIIWNILKENAKRYSNYPTMFDALDAYGDAIYELSFENQQKVIQGILKAMHAAPSQVKLKEISKLKDNKKQLPDSFGRMTKKLSFDDNDIFIFQSPTGIFERRVTVGELAKQAELRKNQ